MFLPSKAMQKISTTLTQLERNQEYEVMFGYNKQKTTLTLEEFRRCALHIKRNKIGIPTKEYSLDISIKLPNTYSDVIRMSVIGGDSVSELNNHIEALTKMPNVDIFTNLLKRADDDTIFKLITKHKDAFKDKHTINISEYMLRCRLSTETPINANTIKEITIEQKKSINFRYKSRVSVLLEETPDYKMSIDITDVRSARSLNDILSLNATHAYEIELEVEGLSNRGVDKDGIKKFMQYIEEFTKVIQKSNNLLTLTEKDNILNEYKTLLGRYKGDTTKLYSMQPRSLELENLINKLPSNYAVTDKADGEKNQLFIHNNKIYYIDNNMNVRFSGLEDSSFPNLTILEGEFVRRQMMCFDCIFANGDDQRKKPLDVRLNALDGVLDVISPNHYKYSTSEFTNSESLEEIKNTYQQEIQSYVLHMTELFESNKTSIEKKYFLFPCGMYKGEVAGLASIGYNNLLQMPYELDGLIFTPIKQNYSQSPEKITYKWKPENMNSLDFYIVMDRDPETGEYMDIFDNTLHDDVKNKVFRVTSLYVGKTTNNEEEPYPFMKEQNLHKAYIPIQDGVLRDTMGNIVQSNTVVEMVYNINGSESPQYNWSIMRTRYDKTEQVQKHRRQYGNYETVASKVWMSINNPVKFEYFNMLATDQIDKYHEAALKLNALISDDVKKEMAYYAKTSNLGKNQRQFHNYIKSLLIYEYFAPKQRAINGAITTYKQRILDVGAGRGGDFEKLIHAQVRESVGIDPDAHGLFFATNSATVRYNTWIKKTPKTTPMTFINMDMGYPLDAKTQTKILGGMTKNNRKNIIEKFGSKSQFDGFNMQFMIHYLFSQQDVFNNMCKNINRYLKDGGYIIVTTFNADRVKQFLGNKKERTITYLDEESNERRSFLIIKDISIKDKPSLGQAIDVHVASFMDENTFQTEYLVYPEWFEQQMDEQCNLKLIDSMDFEDLFNLHKNFFTNVSELETSDYLRGSYFKGIRNLYQNYDNKDHQDHASFEMSKLNRYYVFQKKEKRRR
uniref:mRNA capping enzyme n=1 Tax=Megaviridae environmental sample TaxID=1737588 RepID=A0A5J6VIA7_9VIRU|nr:MAG: mRNA capping enzyme [Megaviridae environmental sample]